MTSQSQLPIFMDGKMSREKVSPEFTDKKLKMLVDKGLLKWKPIGTIQKGSRRGQPTKRLFSTADLLRIANKGLVLGTDKGGSDMSSKWSPRDKAGRSRYQLAKGFQIIERPKDRGCSYDFIRREKMLGKDGKFYMDRRPKVMEMVFNREDVVKEGYRLMVEFNDQKISATMTNGGDCPTYAEYLPVFLAWKRANANVRHFGAIETNVKKLGTEMFGDFKLDRITQKTAEEYRDCYRGAVSDPTISAKIGYLNQVLTKAKNDGYNTKKINRNDLGLVPAKKRKEFMTEEQEKVIWPLLKKHQPMQDLAETILSCAMRPINIIQLKWPDILWNDEIAFVDRSIHKNHEDGEYLLTPDLIEMLRRRKSENGSSNLVFVRHECGNPKPITESWIQRKWRVVKEEANKILEKRGSDLRIPDSLRFYDLKATCLSRAALNGASEFELQAIANHADYHSLLHYVRTKPFQSNARKHQRRGNGGSI